MATAVSVGRLEDLRDRHRVLEAIIPLLSFLAPSDVRDAVGGLGSPIGMAYDPALRAIKNLERLKKVAQKSGAAAEILPDPVRGREWDVLAIVGSPQEDAVKSGLFHPAVFYSPFSRNPQLAISVRSLPRDPRRVVADISPHPMAVYPVGPASPREMSQLISSIFAPDRLMKLINRLNKNR